MSPITHALLPLFIGHRWLPRAGEIPSWRQCAIVGMAGVLPDALSPHLSLAARHASHSHSLPAFFAFMGGALVISRFVRRPESARVAMLACFAYGAHIACDAITGGVGLFLPFSNAVVGDNYLPYWSWDALDLALLFYVYMVFRWLPLRRRLTKPIRSH